MSNLRLIWISAFSSLAIISTLAIFVASQPEPDRRHLLPEREDSPGEALDYFVAQRAAIGETDIPGWRYTQARTEKSKMQLAPKANNDKGNSGWVFAGPDNVGGRTRRLLFSPANPDVMFAGGVSGGVWKSTNAGQSWASTGGAMSNLAVAALVHDPDNANILYAGTGEGLYFNRPVTRSRGVRGDGIFHTRDNGASWQHIASTANNPDFDYVNDLVFDAQSRLFAATRTGVWRSTDRGVSWQKVHAPQIEEGCSDFAYSRVTNNILVSCGAHTQGEVFLSSDAGATWRAVISTPSIGRTRLAVAASNQRIIYALSADYIDYGMRQFARSDDGGLTWQVLFNRSNAGLLESLLLANAPYSVNTACNAATSVAGGGWFHNSLGVDPLDPNIVWAGGVDLFRSNDGGRTFQVTSRWWVNRSQPWYAHADQHGVYFHPQYNGSSNARMYISNDGGIFETQNARAPINANLCTNTATGITWEARNSGYFVTQFYHGSVNADGTKMLAGAQDNGSNLGGFDNPTSWASILGGDGAYSAIDPRTDQRVYASSQFGYFSRSENGGQTFTDISSSLSHSSFQVAFITPMVLDPINPDRIWVAGNSLYRSDNRGSAWSTFSNLPLVGPSIATAIGVSPTNSNQLLVGYAAGLITRTANATSATPTFSTVWPREGNVSSIVIDPSNPQRIYATYSNFGGAHLYRSEDGGANWQILDGSVDGYRLPDVPAHHILINPAAPQQLLLGTDMGLFVSLDGGQRWMADGSGLGNVLIEHMESRSTASGPRVFAFTYGNGAFYAPLSAVISSPINPGWSGAWFDENNPGQGFQVDASPALQQMIVTWYSYLPITQADTRSRNFWLIGNAAVNNGVSTMSLYRTRRGKFNEAYDEVVELAGELTWTFISCTKASVVYRINLDGQISQGSIALTRLSPDAACENFIKFGNGAQAKIPVQAAPGGIEYGHSGTWFDTANPGHGLLIEILPQDKRILAGWYMYDFADVAGDGTQSPIWVFGDGTYSGVNSTVTLYSVQRGQFNTQSPTTLINVGTLNFLPQTCQNGRINYDITLAGQRRTGMVNIGRLSPPLWCAQ